MLSIKERRKIVQEELKKPYYFEDQMELYVFNNLIRFINWEEISYIIYERFLEDNDGKFEHTAFEDEKDFWEFLEKIKEPNSVVIRKLRFNDKFYELQKLIYNHPGDWGA